MKRILLIAVMIVALFASPVVADAPVRVMVDNKMLNQSGVMINGSVYVPLRAVSEAMGASVQWFSKTQSAYILSDAEPIIEGDANFKAVITEALKLLATYDPTAYKMVCDNVRTIGISDVPGNEGVFAVAVLGSDRIDFKRQGIASEYFAPMFVAGLIVHEAVHCTQYGNVPDLLKRQEAIAYSYQYNTLTILNAPQWMKDGCLDSMTRATQ